MVLNKLLVRQLSRLNLSENHPPDDIKSWQAFIERVNHSYIEADQERYLLERAMEISSREMLDLNNKLEEAQHIARLGYWVYDKKGKKLSGQKS